MCYFQGVDHGCCHTCNKMAPKVLPSCMTHKVGGVGHKELSEVLLGCSPGNATFQVGDVGGYPCMEKTLEGLYGKDPGGSFDYC